MVQRKVKNAIKEYSRNELTEQQFKDRLNSIMEEEGGNWYTVSGAISVALSDTYTTDFIKEVETLAVEVDERFENNLNIEKD